MLAPSPLSGRSPRLLTSLAFALDSLWTRPSLGTPEVVEDRLDSDSTITAPGVLLQGLKWPLFSTRGVQKVGKMFFVGVTNM